MRKILSFLAVICLAIFLGVITTAHIIKLNKELVEQLSFFSHLPKSLARETSAPPPHLSGFRDCIFLGKGAQAFAIQDPRHPFVIKIFNKRTRRRLWLAETIYHFLPIVPYLENHLARQEYGLIQEIESYRLCLRELKDLTKIIHLHHQPTKSLPPVRLQSKEPAGQTRILNLNDAFFALQEKLATIEDVFVREKKNLGAKKAVLQKCLALLDELKHRGCFCDDLPDYRNLGIKDGQAIFLDTGSLNKGSPAQCRYFYKKATENLLRTFANDCKIPIEPKAVDE